MLPEFWRNYAAPLLLVLVSGGFLLFEQSLLEVARLSLDKHFTGGLTRWSAGGFYLSLAWLLARHLALAARRKAQGAHFAPGMSELFGKLVGYGVLVAGLLLIAGQVFGKDLGLLLAGSGIFLLILGFALRDWLSAMFSGIVISLEQPFRAGDTVEIYALGQRLVGTVQEIDWRTTRLLTPDARTVVVPNHLIAGNPLINYSLPTPAVQCGSEVFIGYDTSVESVERILLGAVLDTRGLLHTPKPQVLAQAMEKDGITYRVQYWIENYRDSPQAAHRLAKSILRHMRSAGLKVSYPRSEILLSRAHPGIADRGQDRFHLINQVDLFQVFPEHVRRAIAEAMREHRYRAGETVVQVGEHTDSLWLVGEGLVRRIVDRFDVAPSKIEYLGETEYFGAFCLFTGAPHNATAVAETDVMLYAVDKACMGGFLKENKDALEPLCKLLAVMGRRPAEYLRGQIWAFYGPAIQDRVPPQSP